MSKESISPQVCTHSATKDLSVGALNTTTAWSHKFKDLRVTIKASVNITENITITLKSRLGSSYDVLLDYTPLTSESSYKVHWYETYGQDYEVNVACTADNNTGTVYCEVVAVYA